MEKTKLSHELLDRAATMLKAVAHPVRISIIDLLEEGEKLTVTQIHTRLGIDQSAASQHLGILKDKGVLQSKREGKFIYYSLRYERLKDIISCISSCGREV